MTQIPLKYRQMPLRMHRLIMGLNHGDKRMVDHIDHDGLNNCRSNLRITDNSGNQHNRRGKSRRSDGLLTTSKFPGVYWKKSINKWNAQIRYNNKLVHLGYYTNESEAADVYMRAKIIRDSGGIPKRIKANE